MHVIGASLISTRPKPGGGGQKAGGEKSKKIKEHEVRKKKKFPLWWGRKEPTVGFKNASGAEV